MNQLGVLKAMSVACLIVAIFAAVLYGCTQAELVAAKSRNARQAKQIEALEYDLSKLPFYYSDMSFQQSAAQKKENHQDKQLRLLEEIAGQLAKQTRLSEEIEKHLSKIYKLGYSVIDLGDENPK